MKKYLMAILCMVVASGQPVCAELNKRLIAAIESGNQQTVEKTLRRLRPATEEEKSVYVRVAKNAVRERKERVTFADSKRDALKFAAGVALLLPGFPVLLYGVYSVATGAGHIGQGKGFSISGSKNYTFSRRANRTALGGGGLLSLLGGYLAYTGYRCTNALARVSLAKEIDDVVECMETVEEKQKQDEAAKLAVEKDQL